MFTQKINYIWIVNLVLFVAVVFLGIEQAGKGATISKLELDLEKYITQKQELSEDIFKNDNRDKINSRAENLGYAKSVKTLYFNSLDTVASIK